MTDRSTDWDQQSDQWEAMLSGKHPALKKFRRFWGMLPSEPRCKVCKAPFAGPGSMVARARNRGHGSKNPMICSFCETFAEANPGGASVFMTMGFADVRNSTALSAELGDREFSEVIRRFFDAATHAMGESGAFIDKLVGDAANGYWLPYFAGDDFAEKALGSMIELMKRTGHGSPEGPWVPVGAGLHTGSAFMGTVGFKGSFSDFTALGEAVNLAARLAGAAAPGEVLLTDATVEELSTAPTTERRFLDLKGFDDPVPVNVLSVGGS